MELDTSLNLILNIIVSQIKERLASPKWSQWIQTIVPI